MNSLENGIRSCSTDFLNFFFRNLKIGLDIMNFTVVCLFKVKLAVTLRLHYVPGDHGSPKSSAPCDLVIFCLGTQVLLSIITFHHGLSRYPLQTVGQTPGDTTVRYV